MMKKGFTLIELLVVVLIIGILSAVALPQYRRTIAKARTTEAMVALIAITDAQEVYYIAYDDYAADISQLDVKVDPGKNYTYDCSSKRTCFARPTIADCPVIEFHLAETVNAAHDHYLGKHWCQDPGATSKLAKSVSKCFGPEDTTMRPRGTYYLIGTFNN